MHFFLFCVLITINYLLKENQNSTLSNTESKKKLESLSSLPFLFSNLALVFVISSNRQVNIMPVKCQILHLILSGRLRMLPKILALLALSDPLS